LPPARHATPPEQLGLEATGYRRGRHPVTAVAVEPQAGLTVATMAGAKIAPDARDGLGELRPDAATTELADVFMP
jgi:hypothetical protein